MLSVENLMQERWKCIAGYPKGRIAGTILERHEDDDYFNVGGKSDAYYVSPNYLNEFPHLFQKLEWYEERAIEDLPLYLKSPFWVAKVKEWKEGNRIFIDVDYNEPSGTRTYLPATETDYLNYKEQNN
jgi:hypothetical protein